MKISLVLLGPPGAGKGTQARQLRRRWGIPHISTGAMLRDAVQAVTPLGREVADVMNRGGLIDDALITRVVFDRLNRPDATSGFLLDGFPRTIPQARSLDDFMGDRGVLVIVEVTLSEADVLRRLAARLVCAECGANAQDSGEDWSCHDCGGALVPRVDDREQVVKNRLEVYRRETEPLVNYYVGRPGYVRVDGGRLPDDVTTDIVKSVEALILPRQP